MRVVRNVKPVSVAAGGAVVFCGCLGMWHAAILSTGQESDRVVLSTALLSAMLLIQGGVMLTWDRRSESTVLMRAQAADAVFVILPLAVFGSAIISMPEIADPSNPSLWLTGLLLVSLSLSVVPAEKAELSEIPPLRSVGFLDWVRWQNFGFVTLLLSVLLTTMYFTYPLRLHAFTPLVVLLALAQVGVSIWRVVEHHQVSKAGVRLSGMQITWLRAIHVNQGHEAAVKELRRFIPRLVPRTQMRLLKISTMRRKNAERGSSKWLGSLVLLHEMGRYWEIRMGTLYETIPREFRLRAVEVVAGSNGRST